MNNITSLPVFGILLTIICFEVGIYIYKKLKITLFNPLLVAVAIIIFLLKFFNIPLENYNSGGGIITFFLGPATVVLAIPLYKQVGLLKKNAKAILIGIFVGSNTSLLTIILSCKFFGINKEILLSILPKSVTTPIGLDLSASIGGIIPITVVSIVITGITGAVLGPIIFKIFKIDNPIAKGIALGTSAHAVGTSKAIEIGETEGAMSGLAIGIAGITTVLVIPFWLLFI